MIVHYYLRFRVVACGATIDIGDWSDERQRVTCKRYMATRRFKAKGGERG